MESYDVVVSIVVHNSDFNLLRQAVASVRAQKGVHTAIWIINQGSDAAYSRELDTLNGIATIRHRNNGGFGDGHNVALIHAPQSDFVLILNPDARLHDGALRAMMDAASASSDIGLIAPKVLYDDSSLQPLNKREPTVLDLALRLLPSRIASLPWCKRRMDRYAMLDVGYDEPVQLPFASGCCMLIKQHIYQRVGGFDARFFLYFEDADISRRINEIAECWYCPDAVITHVWQRASRKELKYTWIMLRSACRYFSKWGWKLW